MEERPFGAGALPSTEDKRDFDHADHELALGFPFPDEFETDLDIIVPHNVKDQQKIGICTSSITYYMEYLYWKKYGVYTKLSMAFLYLVTKRHIDKNDYEGSSLRSALKAAQKYGCATEATFPSNNHLSYSDFMRQEIPASVMEEALLWKLGEYKPVPVEPNLIRAAVWKYGLVYARVGIDKAWWTPSWRPSDIDPLRKPAGEYTGHAVHFVGFKDGEKTSLRVLNEWGREWNNNGQGTIVYEDYLPHLTECWVATLDPVGTPTPDNSPTVTLETLRFVMMVLKKFGNWAKATARSFIE